jgi:hypothetical protein
MVEDNVQVLLKKIRLNHPELFRDRRRPPVVEIRHMTVCASHAGDGRCDCSVTLVVRGKAFFLAK